jgi:hypothetical protein
MINIILIQCQFMDESREIEFDQDEDIELLKFQVLSVYEGIGEDFLILDFSGREIECLENILAASYVRPNEAFLCATIWIADRGSVSVGSVCSRLIFGEVEIIQPHCR